LVRYIKGWGWIVHFITCDRRTDRPTGDSIYSTLCLICCCALKCFSLLSYFISRQRTCTCEPPIVCLRATLTIHAVWSVRDFKHNVRLQLTDVLARVWLVDDFQFGYVASYSLCYLFRCETHGMDVVRSQSQLIVRNHEVLGN